MDPFSASIIGQYQQSAEATARYNSELSQQYAREQMAFQNDSAARAMAFSAQSAQEARDFNLAAAREANRFNSLEAQKARDWQQMMSDTAYQRAMRDMKLAGLNPVLVGSLGGASTPSGASAAGHAAQSPSASGVSSPGASGTVDTSFSSFLASLIGDLFSRQTQLDAYEVQEAMNRYSADTARLAALGSAQISAASAQKIKRMDLTNQVYMAKNYPTSNQLVGLLLNTLGADGLDNNSAVSRSMKQLVGFLADLLLGQEAK